MAAQTAKADYIPGKSLDMAEETMDKFLKTADVTAVYGLPVEYGETLIIPSRRSGGVLGFGAGEGSGPDRKARGAAAGQAIGGGGRTFSRPVSVIVAGPEWC